MPTVTVDVEGALKDWLNSLVGDLVGTGTPLLLGAHLKRLRSPARGAYVLLSRVGGSGGWNDHADAARISAGIYAPTKESALQGAVAYANHIRALGVAQPIVGAVQLRAADNIAGPVYAVDVDEERYVVTADVFALPL